MKRGIKKASESIDTKRVVDSTRLPYTLPVDFIVRIFQLFLLASSGGALYSLVNQPKDTSAKEWVFCAVVLLYAVYLNLHPSGLKITEKGISHQNWLFQYERIDWEEIKSTTTGIDWEARGTGPYFTLLERKNGRVPMRINIKPYSTRGLSILACFLIEKTDKSTIDKATRRLSTGNVPSIFFKDGQKGIG